VDTLENRRFRRLAATLPLAAALAFWTVNAAVVGPRLGAPAGLYAYLKNLAVGVTFVTSVMAALSALGRVLGRGIVFGRDAVSGVSRGTVLVPFGSSLCVLLVGAVLSALGLRAWGGPRWTAALYVHGPTLLSVGAGCALMGSLVGNLAGSVTLDARDLGRMVRVNLVLLVSVTGFWMFLLWAVLRLLGKRVGTAVP